MMYGSLGVWMTAKVEKLAAKIGGFHHEKELLREAMQNTGTFLETIIVVLA